MKTSESIKNISVALISAQAEISNPKNTAVNPYFKSNYAPLNDILNYVKPILKKHGLGVVQDVSLVEDRVTVSTMIIHESGEYILQTGASAKPDKDTAQGAGSAITYLRRYSLSAALNISSEDDNDGNSANKPQANEPKKPVKTAFSIDDLEKQFSGAMSKDICRDNYKAVRVMNLGEDEKRHLYMVIEARAKELEEVQ